MAIHVFSTAIYGWGNGHADASTSMYVFSHNHLVQNKNKTNHTQTHMESLRMDELEYLETTKEIDEKWEDPA